MLKDVVEVSRKRKRKENSRYVGGTGIERTGRWWWWTLIIFVILRYLGPRTLLIQTRTSLAGQKQ